MALTDEMLVSEKPDMLGGVQRIYRLPNGLGLSALNLAALHSYPFAWEIAVARLTPTNRIADLVYTTPLTSDVEVFDTEDEANAFIARAIEWAAGSLSSTTN